MKFSIENLRINPTTAMRRTGYRFQHKLDSGELSFVREMATSGYPRFHMYVTLEGTTLHISIHVDHKKHTFGEETLHHGEYDNDGALGPEVERLKIFLGG